MPANKKEKAEKIPGAAPKTRLGTRFKLPMVQREELIATLNGLGINFTESLAASLKIPQYVLRGGRETQEYYDVRSMPPAEYGDADSPLACYEKKIAPPAWVAEWYLRLVEEGGRKFLLFIYRPKKVFMKCEAVNAERAVSDEMYLRTIRHD